MNCATHAEVQAAAYCIRCGRALCTECTRNVRGSVYCESCLADIVGANPGPGTGAGASSSSSSSVPPPPITKTVGGTNPPLAFFLGLIPGVGAIYNGEFMKAAVHVLIFGILTSLADKSGGAGPLIGMATFAFYVYMPFEAYYSAKKRDMAAQGVDLETPIDRLHQQFGKMQNKELWGGVALVVVGGLFLADNFDVVRLDRLGRLWPIVLIGLGVWMLKRFQGKAT